MAGSIEIYKTSDQLTEIRVQFEDDTVWLTQAQMVDLFESSKANISEHISHIYINEKLTRKATVRKFRTVQMEGKRLISRQRDHFNLDMIISIGYRINSKRGIEFRQWATARLKDYLVKGYAINEKRLKQTQQEIEYLKTGIRIVGRALEDAANDQNKEVFKLFSKGLKLLDDFDHEELDKSGNTKAKTRYPSYKDYMNLIYSMYSDYKSEIFALPKDDSFKSSIGQIMQTISGKDIYPSIEEKAANLLYFIIKNHSFVDGNKRIAAACFLFFLQTNRALLNSDGKTILDNNTLAALTLFIATSKPEEAGVVKRLIISILNRN